MTLATASRSTVPWVEEMLRAVARVTGGLALSGLLAAVALLPTAEFARSSLRMQDDWPWRLVWSTSWPQVLSALWPLADWPRGSYWGEDQWVHPQPLPGDAALRVRGAGGRAGPRRARPFAVGALVLVALSLGRHFAPAAWVLLHVPPFSLFRYPVKYFVGAALCVSVLSAFGWTRWAGSRGAFAPRARARPWHSWAWWAPWPPSG
ncbi:hypothetical protein ACLEQD_42930, partial [Corallococcus sp. 4LFB]